MTKLYGFLVGLLILKLFMFLYLKDRTSFGRTRSAFENNRITGLKMQR